VSKENGSKWWVSVVTAVIVAALTALATMRVSEQHAEVEFVKLGIDILKTAPSSSTALRAWSQDVVNRYSEVDLSQEAADSLAVLGNPMAIVDLEGPAQNLPLMEGTPLSIPELGIRELSVAFRSTGEGPAAVVAVEFYGEKPVRMIVTPGSGTSISDPGSRSPYELRLTTFDEDRKLLVFEARAHPGRDDEAVPQEDPSGP
jgi:hypothetical protein